MVIGVTEMSVFKITAEYISTEEIEVEADCEESARQKFDDGEFISEVNTGFELHDIKSVKFDREVE